MNNIAKILSYPVQRKDLNKWLKNNLDKEGLEENFLDGHGYYKNPEKEEESLVVYVIKKKPLIFIYRMESDDYIWKIIGNNEWVRWKDVPPASIKAKSRF